jgi:hypothetical protein
LAVTAANAKLATSDDLGNVKDKVGDVGSEVDDLGGTGEQTSISSIAEILEEKKGKETRRDTAVSNTVSATTNGFRNGYEGLKNSGTYKE